MATNNGNSNTYEELRKRCLDENKKRFEDLGISAISKTLSKLSTPEKKQRQLKPKLVNPELVQVRRSSRARTVITSYRDDLDIELSPTRRRSRFNSSWTSYIARPMEEVKLAAYEDRLRALKAAEEFQDSLESGNPSFVKTMQRSHVYSCFWLGLPTHFCNAHLPKKDVDMTLEDEDGSTCAARLLASRTGLSGGWRGFALEHKLDDGDAVVFELVEPEKFKLYIFRISSTSQIQEDDAEEDGSAKATTKASKGQNKSKSRSSKKQSSKEAKGNKVSKVETSKSQSEPASEVIPNDLNSVEKNGAVEENDGKDETTAITTTGPATKNLVEKNEVAEENGEKDEIAVLLAESLKENGKRKRNVIKPRKKPAERFLRRRV
ncbi:B3 domain-containing protein Os05g0481400 [Euphorbia peplus]|nr:B3 domain-containing protein Os05g0481400 [Euphorbia peplus]